MAYDVCNDDTDRPLIILYVGDYDPYGMYMSKCDLPERFLKYGGDHITLKRIALTSDQVADLPSFPAKDKKKDPRYAWFVEHYGKTCWGLTRSIRTICATLLSRPFGTRSNRLLGNAAPSLRRPKRNPCGRSSITGPRHAAQDANPEGLHKKAARARLVKIHRRIRFMPDVKRKHRARCVEMLA